MVGKKAKAIGCFPFLPLNSPPFMDNDKLKLKQRLLTECLRIQKDAVEQLKKAMLEAQQSANDNTDDTEEILFNSYREEMQNKRDLFARQLDEALDALALLQKVNGLQSSKDVSFGAVVITESQKLFISISLGQIHSEGETYVAISPSAPLFKLMVGKHIGDSYQFRDKNTKILEII
jgi:hypothetical protein